MKDDVIDVACPKCGNEFQLPLGEALTPLIDAEIERQLDAQRQQIARDARSEATQESDERNRTAIAMRDKMIADMRLEVDELRRKVDLGSQQVQGEVQELALEKVLKTSFPRDRITAIPKGQTGGDLLQEVLGQGGLPVGAILWEIKNTRSWSNEWLSKTKHDMREARAAMCVIATATLPKGVEIFDRVDGVYVVSVRCFLPLAQILRQVLIEIALVRATAKEGSSAAQKLLSYVTGQEFRNRLVAIMESCASLQGDLNADKRSSARRWARTQQHIDALVQSMGGMFGELQGLLGKSLPEVAGLTEDVGTNTAHRNL